jgi:hypothetical protein
VLTTDYAQTAASLVAAAATVATLRNQVRTVQVTIPSAATLAAGTLLLAAFVLAWRRRHRPDHALAIDSNQANPGPLEVDGTTGAIAPNSACPRAIDATQGP